jgi:hypothetical protein
MLKEQKSIHKDKFPLIAFNDAAICEVSDLGVWITMHKYFGLYKFPKYYKSTDFSHMVNCNDNVFIHEFNMRQLLKTYIVMPIV